jgi:predicted HTH domain antitoxin
MSAAMFWGQESHRFSRRCHCFLQQIYFAERICVHSPSASYVTVLPMSSVKPRLAISLVTRYGRPVFVAVPVDGLLRENGIDVALAAKLFDDEQVTLAQGAKLASMTLSAFMELLSGLAIPVVRYAAEELVGELETLAALPESKA